MDQSHPFLAGSLKDQQNQTFFPNCRKKSPSQKMAQEILRFDIEKKLHRSFGARCHLILFSTKLNYNANTLAEVQSTKLTATKKVS